MFGTRVLALQAHETEQLICALQELYADRDWHFESYRPDQWYLRLAADAEVRFHSLEAAIGHPIDSYMPEGKERDYWLRFLNEVQMLFHGHDVNNDRLLRNEFAVNSVWCWGEGRLPATLQARWHSIYSDDLFVQGLAALCGIPCISPPESANVLMRDLAKSSKPDANRQILIVLDQVESSRLEGDASSWQEQVKCIQDQWFLPLQEAQGRGQVGSITIDVCNGSRYRYLRRHRMRVWRRTPAFGDVLVHA